MCMIFMNGMVSSRLKKNQRTSFKWPANIEYQLIYLYRSDAFMLFYVDNQTL